MPRTRINKAGLVICAEVILALSACSTDNAPGTVQDTHSFDDRALPRLSAADGIQTIPDFGLPMHVYDVSAWPELWGGYASKQYETVIPLFLIRDEYSVVSPALFPPRGYNDDRRAFDAPTSTAEYDKEAWPDIVGVVEAKTGIRISRVLLYGTPKVHESFTLLIEAEILDGPWKGTRVDASSPGFDTFEELPKATFQLADVGRIQTDLLISSPDSQFLREVTPK